MNIADDPVSAFNDGYRQGREDAVVRGEWTQHHETTTDNETLPYGWECSLCGRWEMEKQPFCNCGAKMEVEP